jgi:PAS domain S-box-containing protein
MVAGLSTPLHLAASLLALFAAAGLALAVLPAGRRLASAPAVAVAAGAVLVALGHALSGALLEGSGTVAGTLRAVGLSLIALALSRRLLAVSGPAILVPLAPAPAAAVAAVAGTLAGLRALQTGRDGALVGAGLVCWGVAEAVATVSVTGAAWLTIAGAMLLAAWLWQVSAPRLLAKFAFTFVAGVLAVVVLIAGVLSGFGASELAREEIDRLQGFADRLASEIGAEWPRTAINAARPLRTSGSLLLGIDPEDPSADTDPLFAIYDLSFREQDFFLVYSGTGELLLSYAPDEEVLGGAFLLQMEGSPLIDRLLDGAGEDGQLVTVGGRLVALGGVRLVPPEGRAEDPAIGALVTGRLVDDFWAQRSREEIGVELFVEVGGRPSAVSAGLQGFQTEILTDLARSDPGQVVGPGGRTRYAAATPVADPSTQEVLGTVVTVSSPDAIAALEREQARRLFLLALVGASLAGLAAGGFGRRLVEPLRRRTAAAAAVREGRLDTEADVDTLDEVGDLGRTFNEMTASLSAQSTQLRDAAAVQARLRARLEALTESMSDALVAVDHDGIVLTFNPAAETLAGQPAEEVLGRPLEEALRGRGPGGASAAEALGPPDSEEPVAVQLLLEGPDGRPVPTAATAAPVRAGDRHVIGRVLVLRDVTREAEVERMKTEFLSNVSHELRTPLTPIRGYAEVLARRDMGPDATRRFAGQILDATGRLERVVALIVDFAALDSGRVRLRREPTPLDRMIGEVVEEWRERLPEREFHRRIAKELPPVLVDPAMLRRCLDELVDNAVKFSPSGGAVSISARRDAHDASRVRLSVRDRGVGLEPERVTQVFADFYQVDASETRHYGGLGLGLALVRRIVDGFDGEVTVDSRPGRGATFNLLLPVADHTVSTNGGRRKRSRRPAGHTG